MKSPVFTPQISTGNGARRLRARRLRIVGSEGEKFDAMSDVMQDDGRASSDGSEPSGELIAGDGVNTPLLEYTASRFRGGRMFTPNLVRIWGDRVEEYEHHAVLKKNTRAINFAQVAQVVMNKGLRWSDIRVESTGGHIIKLVGMKKEQAEQAKILLDEKVHLAKTGALSVDRGASEQPDVVDQLRKFAELRDQGIITEDEFAAQKAKLLG